MFVIPFSSARNQDRSHRPTLMRSCFEVDSRVKKERVGALCSRRGREIVGPTRSLWSRAARERRRVLRAQNPHERTSILLFTATPAMQCSAILDLAAWEGARRIPNKLECE
jgi:hypothetical protein